jgi:nicotinate phosphoribosyltransferase
VPKIKLSENPEKVTTPGVKKVYRVYDSESGKMKADLVALEHETVDITKPLMLFDPKAPWKQMHLDAGEYYTKELLVPIFKSGKRILELPCVMEIKEFCTSEQNTLWEEYRRPVNPQIMPVDLSQELYDLKQQMIYEARQSRG